MRTSLRFILAAGVAGFFIGAAQAQPANGGPAVGVGMICDTAEQAAQFISLRESGSAPQKAMEAVNKDAGNPRACGVAAIAFVRDATLTSRAVADKLVQLVRINVVAGFNGAGWQKVDGTIQFAVMEGEGEAI
ncbi:MAG: hypothetical protein ACK4UO_09475 [Pseudolabrys sp.]